MDVEAGLLINARYLEKLVSKMVLEGDQKDVVSEKVLRSVNR